MDEVVLTAEQLELLKNYKKFIRPCIKCSANKSTCCGCSDERAQVAFRDECEANGVLNYVMAMTELSTLCKNTESMVRKVYAQIGDIHKRTDDMRSSMPSEVFDIVEKDIELLSGSIKSYY